MKKCQYCGRENADDSVYCFECCTEIVSCEGPTPSKADDHDLSKFKNFPRARPSIMIVAGAWAIFLPGLILNIASLTLVLSGAVEGVRAVITVVLSIGCGAICAYVLHVSVINYLVQKERAREDVAAEALQESVASGVDGSTQAGSVE